PTTAGGLALRSRLSDRDPDEGPIREAPCDTQPGRRASRDGTSRGCCRLRRAAADPPRRGRLPPGGIPLPGGAVLPGGEIDEGSGPDPRASHRHGQGTTVACPRDIAPEALEPRREGRRDARLTWSLDLEIKILYYVWSGDTRIID